MLTVIRELAEEAEARATPDLPVSELLRALVQRGEDALARTRSIWRSCARPGSWTRAAPGSWSSSAA